MRPRRSPSTPDRGYGRCMGGAEHPPDQHARISTGEIWDIEVVGQRVFIAGTFSSLQNTTGNTAVVNQRFLASYNYQTGLIDTAFRPPSAGWRDRRRGLTGRHQAVRHRQVPGLPR